MKPSRKKTAAVVVAVVDTAAAVAVAADGAGKLGKQTTGLKGRSPRPGGLPFFYSFLRSNLRSPTVAACKMRVAQRTPAAANFPCYRAAISFRLRCARAAIEGPEPLRQTPNRSGCRNSSICSSAGTMAHLLG